MEVGSYFLKRESVDGDARPKLKLNKIYLLLEETELGSKKPVNVLKIFTSKNLGSGVGRELLVFIRLFIELPGFKTVRR